MIAALYVERGGVYWDLPGVDPWDESRDARLYDGPWPVVAHPPCARWSVLAGLVESRGGRARGDDDWCFASALDSVRRWGGVLEHPARTAAWRQFDLPRPIAGGWIRGFCGGWSCEVAQGSYGHRAQKLTWLYYVGNTPPPRLNWLRPRGTKVVELMTKSERLQTPVAFRDLLLSMAASAIPKMQNPG